MGLGERVEGLEQPQVVEEVQGAGVDGVAAEVPQEVRVLLQHGDLYARSREQEAEDEARRACTCDDTGVVRRPVLVCGVARSVHGPALPLSPQGTTPHGAGTVHSGRHD